MRVERNGHRVTICSLVFPLLVFGGLGL
jgi:hypothetical protein